MARPEDQTASFMMFCLRESSSELFIPVKFVAKYRQVAEQESMKLVTGAGKGWKVKIEKDKYENYCMKEGWPEFRKDNKIDDMDFLIFRLVGDSTFNVKIYRCDCCLKEPTTSDIGSEDGIKSENESKIGRENKREKRRGRGSSNPLYFEKPLARHQKSRVSLPQEFARAANMEEKSHVRMVFLPTNRCETVVLDPRPENYRIDLSKGWPEFRVANGLEYEKIYSFEFKPNENAIHVKEVMKKEE